MFNSLFFVVTMKPPFFLMVSLFREITQASYNDLNSEKTSFLESTDLNSFRKSEQGAPAPCHIGEGCGFGFLCSDHQAENQRVEKGWDFSGALYEK